MGVVATQVQARVLLEPAAEHVGLGDDPKTARPPSTTGRAAKPRSAITWPADFADVSGPTAMTEWS